MDVKKLFSSNLNYYLNLQGKRAKDLIEDLPASRTAVYGWLGGSSFPHADTLDEIANYLGMSVRDLLTPIPNVSTEYGDTDVENDDTRDMTLGQRLRFIRLRKGESQEEVAKAAYVSRYVMSKYENDHGEPKIDTLRGLKEHWDISFDYLLDGIPKRDE